MIRYQLNPNLKKANEQATPWLTDFSSAVAESVLQFHRALPGYQPTPLHRLSALADDLDVAEIWVKDEAHRFGLNAFKALGVTYALAKLIQQKANLPHLQDLFSRRGRAALQHATIITATDGNHGRAVAWSAEQLGCQAVVYLPQGVSSERVTAIEQHGAQSKIIAGNYDEAVRQAARQAETQGWFLLQDTAWPGYTERPRWIMQGYLSLLCEALNQMSNPPSHVLVQCGVGSLAGSIFAHLCAKYNTAAPKLIAVEPDVADCFYQSSLQADGQAYAVQGDLDTIMAGLACGETSLLAWPILRDCATAFLSVDDSLAELGMCWLAQPLGQDPPIVSGESGAVTLGTLATICRQPAWATLRQELGLNAAARVLLLSTEGDTDPESYQRILAQAGLTPDKTFSQI